MHNYSGRSQTKQSLCLVEELGVDNLHEFWQVHEAEVFQDNSQQSVIDAFGTTLFNILVQIVEALKQLHKCQPQII